MKIRLIVFTSSIIALFTVSIFIPENHSTSIPEASTVFYPSPLDLKNHHFNSNKEISDKYLISTDWYSSAGEQIKKEEYNISYSEEYKAFQSPNRNNNMRFIYYNDGFTVKPRITKIPLFDENNLLLKDEEKTYKIIPEWNVRFFLAGLSRNDANNSVGNISTKSDLLTNSVMHSEKNKAFIEDNNIRIDYENDIVGMRQNFTIKNKVAGEGKLRLEIGTESELRMFVGEDAVMLKSKEGNDILKYSSLKVFDAKGKILNSYFENSESENSDLKKFAIVVNDDNAVYPVTIDPLSSTANWTAEVNQNGASFGISVSSAGDVNGDGYGDVIIGANTYDNTGPNTGAVFGYYGSAGGLSAAASWSRMSAQNFAEFGNDVSTAGDVNGDGYSDIIVGSYRYTNTLSLEGAAFVYYGPLSGTNGGADWTSYGGQANAYYGISVSTAGDPNLDGKSDIIIGAYQYDQFPYTDNGKAFVYFSTGSGFSSPWTYSGIQYNEGLGSSVSFAGDVDNYDGSDIVIGSYNYSAGQTGEGRIYIFRGIQGQMNFQPSPYTFESNSPGANLGVSVSTAGDVNGDTYCDVIAGAYNYTNGETYEGKVYLFLGANHSNPTVSSWSPEGGQDNMSFGLSVSTAGDVNGDGYADVIIGAPYFNGTFVDEGKAFIYTGSNISGGLSASPYWTSASGQGGAQYGYSVSIAGDVNGDGISDVIIGAPYYDGVQIDCGRAFAFYGSPNGLSLTANWSQTGVIGNQINSDFGICVSTIGDINNDGYADVAVGAPNYDVSGNKGGVFIYKGSPNGLTALSATIFPSDNYYNSFGFSVASAGDVNGDGFGDLIIGSPFYSLDYLNEGKAYLYYGNSGVSPLFSGWSKKGNSVNAFLGNSVASAGDINGDGYADVLTAAYRYTDDQSEEGRVFLYNGSPSGLLNSASWSADGNFAYAQFGTSAATAGDVNGDGYNDVIIGAPSYDFNNIGGRAYLYYGNYSGLSTSPGWTAQAGLTGQANASFGASVGCAGDVDGNGIADVLVGAPYYHNGVSNTGRVYVYQGFGTGLSAAPNWTYTPSSGNYQFGASVSTAGDINGDGYSDIIIGEPAYTNVQVNKGKAYVFNGSSSGLQTGYSWTSEGSQNNELFATSVSTAGDVNGDGYSDVIIGAYHHNNGSNFIGAVFAHYGNDGNSRRHLVRQFIPNTYTGVYSGGYTGVFQSARFAVSGMTPFGLSRGKIVYESKLSGNGFSTGSNASITNSTSFSGSGNYSFMRIYSYPDLKHDVTGLSYFLAKETKWRARVQYDVYTSPYQKYGPWKYYTNYIPLPNWSLRPVYHAGFGLVVNLRMIIQGYYDPKTDAMRRSDTVTMFIHEDTPPYAALDSAISVLSPEGYGTFDFINTPSNCCKRLKMIHFNSITTWSSGNVGGDSSIQTYDFTTGAAQAYGDNMIQADDEPLTYAIYNGDIDQSGFIDGTDGGIVDNDAYNFTIGYVDSDLTGDEIVDGSDYVIVDNNSANFISAVEP